MPSAKASGAICVQRFDDSLTSCNSHYVSHFAAFFIVARAKISVVESFGYLRRGGFRRNRPDGFSIVFGVCVCVFSARGRPRSQTPRTPPLPLPPKGERQRRGEKRSKFAERIDHSNDPSAGSPTETLLRLLLPLGGRVYRSSRRKPAETANDRQSQRFTSTPNR